MVRAFEELYRPIRRSSMLLAGLQPATPLVTSSNELADHLHASSGYIDERDAARRLVVYGRNALAHAERAGLGRRI